MKTRVHLESYYQVFQNKFGFQSDLSIIDLLFNMGPEAQLILKNSSK
ncbi:MAG: WbqC family protein [Bacteroidales bacterium]